MAHIDPQAKAQMQNHILALLQLGTSSTAQLLEEMTRQSPQFDHRLFYPALSGLNLANLVCWHWHYGTDGPAEKHFFLTGEGKKMVSTFSHC